MSITKILRMYDLPYKKKWANVIMSILDRFNVDYENVGGKYHKKYFFDYSYFDVIDSKEKAYWLGFLYADGYISTEKNVFGCGLNKKDVGHLHKFIGAIGVNNDPIRFDKSTDSYRITLSSDRLVSALMNYGFTSKKSYDSTDQPFIACSDEFKKYFILGLWDGDGYVSIGKDNKNLTGVISNNNILLMSISNYVNSVLEDDFCKVSYFDGYPRIRLTGVKAKRFLDWLYKDATVYLDRKYEKYMMFKDSFYDKYPYHNIRRLKSGKYEIVLQHNNKKMCFGVFDTVREAVHRYNEIAPIYQKDIQEYIGEIITKEEYADYLANKRRCNDENIGNWEMVVQRKRIVKRD